MKFSDIRNKKFNKEEFIEKLKKNGRSLNNDIRNVRNIKSIDGEQIKKMLFNEKINIVNNEK